VIAKSFHELVCPVTLRATRRRQVSDGEGPEANRYCQAENGNGQPG
jgi:hypothetical protein